MRADGKTTIHTQHGSAATVRVVRNEWVERTRIEVRQDGDRVLLSATSARQLAAQLFAAAEVAEPTEDRT